MRPTRGDVAKGAQLCPDELGLLHRTHIKQPVVIMLIQVIIVMSVGV